VLAYAISVIIDGLGEFSEFRESMSVLHHVFL